ncbi:galactokinase [Shewanella mangrovi]|uniref:Galactokinase n=1 Tax=Shewanella mangrovi TaxID=1515746 RepID=A0A094JGB3_9GAMM|nr:galactokinase [Shewanella mangrovi]KFZ38965.1 galactokinase [Shewanella mangrovi]
MSNPAPSATKLFVKTFGTKPDMLFSAPARVNLIGEHTDYNDGFVLPVAINFHTVIAVKVRKDDQFRAVSDAFSDIRQWRFGDEGEMQPEDGWINYLKGFSAAVALSGLPAKGLDLAVVGNVPANAGLAASASLEIAFGSAINDTSQLHLSPLAVAQLAQRGENHYVGYACGIMDQITSAMAEEECALLIDCMDLECQPVKIPDELSLMLINSGLPSVLQSDEFNLRLQQCEQVAHHFGLDSLRDLTLAQLQSAEAELDPIAFRRARHVITENERTQQAARALARGNISKMSQLMAESHASIRDDFEISTPEIDTLVALVHETVGSRGGVRLAGKGFGGCVVALVEHELTDQVIATVEQQYQAKTGLEASIYLCSPCEGAGRIDK